MLCGARAPNFPTPVQIYDKVTHPVKQVPTLLSRRVSGRREFREHHEGIAWPHEPANVGALLPHPHRCQAAGSGVPQSPVPTSNVPKSTPQENRESEVVQ